MCQFDLTYSTYIFCFTFVHETTAFMQLNLFNIKILYNTTIPQFQLRKCNVFIDAV